MQPRNSVEFADARQRQRLSLPMLRSVFSIVKVEPDAVWLVDSDQAMSVTNDAERVVEHILHHYGISVRIFYRDTDGRWDEIVHNGTSFIAFDFGTAGREPPK